MPVDSLDLTPRALSDATRSLPASAALLRRRRQAAGGERTAVILYYRDEMAVRDIARVVGVTTGTIKTLLFRARRHLRGRLEAAPVSGQETST